jgi:hypothetical protein
MKKTFLSVLGLVVALSFTSAIAAEKTTDAPAKKESSSQQDKAARKALLEKYDLNKSGRLDKEEKSKMTPEDLEKWNSTAPKKKTDGEAKPEKKDDADKAKE